jgi:hypothetical protein
VNQEVATHEAAVVRHEGPASQSVQGLFSSRKRVAGAVVGWSRGQQILLESYAWGTAILNSEKS